MSFNVEGTGYSGEHNNVDETSEFYEWMVQQQAKPLLIKKLIQNGYDSIDMIQSIDMEDLPDICTELQLKVKEKINLKMIIKNQSNQHVIVDKEETDAMIKMGNKLKSMQNALHLVANTEKKIDEQVSKHMEIIKNTFKEIYNKLQERETKLIQQLHQIANEKKHKLKNISKTLNQQTNTAQKTINSCHKSLKKSVEISNIERRKQGIIKISKDVNNIKIITKNDPVVTANKIEVFLDKISMIKSINSFGFCSGNVVPILMSLTDNNDFSVALQWKLSGDKPIENNNKLKVEWSEIESKHNENDNEDDMKQDWKYKREFKVKNENDYKVILKVTNKTTSYLFRIQYFDGNVWSVNSNYKAINVKVVTDKWDPNCIHNDTIINGNSVKHTTNGYRSAFLTNVVSKGIHIWKFKADNITNSCWDLIGIWKTNTGTPPTYPYFTNKVNNGYAYLVGSNYLTNPAKPGNFGLEYHDQQNCKSGDIIEMILNFNTLCLSYKVNNIDRGKAFDIDKTTYRAAISYFRQNHSFTLMSYQTK